MATKDDLLRWMKGERVDGLPDNEAPYQAQKRKAKAAAPDIPIGKKSRLNLEKMKRRAGLPANIEEYDRTNHGKWEEWVHRETGARDGRLFFGKHKGERLSNVPDGYLKWIIEEAEEMDLRLVRLAAHLLGYEPVEPKTKARFVDDESKASAEKLFKSHADEVVWPLAIFEDMYRESIGRDEFVRQAVAAATDAYDFAFIYKYVPHEWSWDRDIERHISQLTIRFGRLADWSFVTMEAFAKDIEAMTRRDVFSEGVDCCVADLYGACTVHDEGDPRCLRTKMKASRPSTVEELIGEHTTALEVTTKKSAKRDALTVTRKKKGRGGASPRKKRY